MAIETHAKLMTTPEAADYLGLAEDTVRKYIQRGLIRPFDTVGRAYLISEAELNRYKIEKSPRGNPTFSRAG